MTKTTWTFRGEITQTTEPVDARLRFLMTLQHKDGGPITMATEATMTADQTITLTLDPASFIDREGNVAPIDGVPVWATSDETKVSLEVAADGMTCKCVSHLVGEADVLVEVDVDPGEDVIKRNGSVHFTVTPGQVAELVVGVGDPVQKA